MVLYTRSKETGKGKEEQMAKRKKRKKSRITPQWLIAIGTLLTGIASIITALKR
jgi:hypothetical protein